MRRPAWLRSMRLGLTAELALVTGWIIALGVALGIVFGSAYDTNRRSAKARI